MNIQTKTFTLQNDVDIPVVGLGTWQMTPEEAERSVSYALKNGYRHIDTARTYQNEEGVGRGLKKSGLNREDYFLTSKISAFSKTYTDAKNDIQASLKTLQTSYLDLMIIHAPRPWDEMHINSIANTYYSENIAVWRALEEAYKEGKIRAIGVSNFDKKDINNLIKNVEIMPMLNQIKYHIGERDEELVQYCQEQDMVVEAYSPIGTGKLLNHPAIEKIAKKYKKSTAQICIRYAYQKGHVVLPKSVHEQYIDENIRIDFELSTEDMGYLNRIKI